MTLQQLIFLGLAAVIVLAALFVVSTRNLFRAALMLVVSFFGIAGLYVLLDAGFFAVAQVLVYIGAISILIIFGVMLTRGMQGMEPRNTQAVGGAVVAAIIFGVLVLLLGPFHVTINNREFGNIAWNFAKDATGNAPAVADTYIASLGVALVDVNQFALPFELASVMILLVMIGAIWVARERKVAEVQADRRDILAEEREEEASIEAAKAGASSTGVPAVPAAPGLPETAIAHGAGGHGEH